jgi:2-amino-4-hydroxy-6-hydroxymethyldihydropteridine diphosphokinase
MRSAIALGSNMGDRLGNLREAFERVLVLNEPPAQVLFSSIYETSPIASKPGTPFYLNAVLEIDFRETPISLLKQLLEIERTMGRPSRRPRNASRLIDLDILYVGDLVLNDPDITIPHPRLSGRRFVLTPLAEFAPDLVLPGQNVSVAELLAQVADPGKVVRIASTLNSHE